MNRAINVIAQRSTREAIEMNHEWEHTITFTKELEGILNIPRAGSIFSSLAKETWGWNQAQVTCTHNGATSVGFKAPPNYPTQ